MIEIIHPGILSIFVDCGREGKRGIGIPPSPALDGFALRCLNHLLGNEENSPAIEVFGEKFSLRFNADICGAITGARVNASLQGGKLRSWTTFEAKPGDLLVISKVTEGFRYYVGFSGAPVLEKIIGSYSTNLECRFGGYHGRALRRGDRLEFESINKPGIRRIPEEFIPKMAPPHTLDVLRGPEYDYFTAKSLEEFMAGGTGAMFAVSSKSNRTGIRLEGKCLTFKEGVGDSIISEGLLPGTIQVPGDGMPIIQLHERTIGGYARPAVIAKAERDLLAHLKPGDPVMFRAIGIEEAEHFIDRRAEIETLIKNT